VNVGSGFTRRRLVLRRALDWSRWKESGNILNEEADDEEGEEGEVERQDERSKLGEKEYDNRGTMLFISPITYHRH
jgi:hypothetical protein